jgi:hypothetical protein
MSDLSIEFNYFLAHQEELVARYRGRYIALVGERVHGSYRSLHEAYRTSCQQLPLGTFLLQQCLPGAGVYTQVFANPGVAFFGVRKQSDLA